MKHNYEKFKFLEILRENPWISFAAKKSGISRSTIYRWMKDDPELRRAIDEAQKAGSSQLDEMAEMGLVKKIKEGHFQAIKYYLDRNNPKYMTKPNIYVPPPHVHTHSTDAKVCKICIHTAIEQGVIEKEMKEHINKEIERLAHPKTEKDREDYKKLIEWLEKGRPEIKPKRPPLRVDDLL